MPESLKPRANGRNIVGQQLPTLLDVTCYVRLHTLLDVVAQSLKPVKLFSQQLPTFLLFRDRRSVAQQHDLTRIQARLVLESDLKHIGPD